MLFMNIMMILFIASFAIMATVLIVKTICFVKKFNREKREQLKRQYGLEKFAQKD